MSAEPYVPAERTNGGLAMRTSRTLVPAVVATVLAVTMWSSPVVVAEAVSNFSASEWIGSKIAVKKTPTLSLNLEVPLHHFPPGDPLRVDLVCAVTASRNDGEIPVRKVKTKVGYTFYGRYSSDPEYRQPLQPPSTRRVKTTPDGNVLWGNYWIIDPSAERPDRVGFEVQATGLNTKKVDEHSIICELTAYVTLA